MHGIYMLVCTFILLTCDSGVLLNFYLAFVIIFSSSINMFRALKVFAVGDNLGAWVLNEKEGHALIPLLCLLEISLFS
jgi:hypothetical protein